jgi:hypothetical protein
MRGAIFEQLSARKNADLRPSVSSEAAGKSKRRVRTRRCWQSKGVQKLRQEGRLNLYLSAGELLLNQPSRKTYFIVIGASWIQVGLRTSRKR